MIAGRIVKRENRGEGGGKIMGLVEKVVERKQGGDMKFNYCFLFFFFLNKFNFKST